MKKILLVAAFAGLAMASCKKDYTCECTTSGKVTNNGTVVSTTGPVTSSSKINGKKADAKTACEKNNGTVTSGSGNSTSEATIACSIK